MCLILKSKKIVALRNEKGSYNIRSKHEKPT